MNNAPCDAARRGLFVAGPAEQAIKKKCRDRLEAAALPQQRLSLDRQRDQTGRRG
jgi:hypothetical protein